jgi:hypothetical protein
MFPQESFSPQPVRLSLEFSWTGSRQVALEEIDRFPVGGFCRGHRKQDLASQLNPAFAWCDASCALEADDNTGRETDVVLMHTEPVRGKKTLPAVGT